ncbi:MAG: hypothetical protein PHU71_03350 [Candidatus Gracilibacteria bacterium]|nr:hypothetical protein [Candidatus Gracilibacteria bacterium]
MAEVEQPLNKRSEENEKKEKEPVVKPGDEQAEIPEEQIEEATSPLSELVEDDSAELERLQAQAEVTQTGEQLPEEGLLEDETPALEVSEKATKKEKETLETESKPSEVSEQENKKETDEDDPSGGDDETKQEDLQKTVKEDQKKTPEKNGNEQVTSSEQAKDHEHNSVKEAGDEEHLNLNVSIPDTPAGLEKALVNLRSGALKPHNFHDYLAVLFMANSALGLEHSNPRLKLDLSQTAKQEILSKLASFECRPELKLKSSHLRKIDQESPVTDLLSSNSTFLLNDKEENITRLVSLRRKVVSELEKEEISTQEAAQASIAKKKKEQSKEKDQ